MPESVWARLLIWVVTVLLTTVIFMAIREMICWYLRLTPILALLEKIEQHLDNMEKQTLNRMLPRAERRRPGLVPEAPQLEPAAVAPAAEPHVADQAKL
jgi:hypothetical protein